MDIPWNLQKQKSYIGIRHEHAEDYYITIYKSRNLIQALDQIYENEYNRISTKVEILYRHQTIVDRTFRAFNLQKQKSYIGIRHNMILLQWLLSTKVEILYRHQTNILTSTCIVIYKSRNLIQALDIQMKANQTGNLQKQKSYIGIRP